MPHHIDTHVGSRLRLRRRLLGLTQGKLARAADIRFQQIQKYENATNRISASKLWLLSNALDVTVSYFFEGIGHEAGPEPGGGEGGQPSASVLAPGILEKRETVDLVRRYYRLGEATRRRFLELLETLAADG